MDIIYDIINSENTDKKGWRIINNNGEFGVYNKKTSNLILSVLNKGAISVSSNISSNFINLYSNINVITGYTGGYSKWTTTEITTGSNIYYNLGNVGIGTTNPATYPLVVGGDVNIIGEYRVNGSLFKPATSSIADTAIALATSRTIAGVQFNGTEDININYSNLINKPDLTVIETNNTNASNYILTTSNLISQRITNLTTDMITGDINAFNKFIVNNLYNNNLEVNGTLTINSNLIVLGDSTRLDTNVYTTERLEVVNANNTTTALMVQQNSVNSDIFVASNMSSAVFRIANNGDVIINGDCVYKRNNRDVILDASNYILTTSNNLINKVKENDNNASNYILTTSNNLINKVRENDNNASNYILTTSNNLINKVRENDNNVSNYILTTSNNLINYNNLLDTNTTAKITLLCNTLLTIDSLNDNNASNYVLATSNIIQQQIKAIDYNTLINKPITDVKPNTSNTFQFSSGYNVGIGTSTALTPLHIYNDTNATIRLQTPVSSGPSIEFIRGDTIDASTDWKMRSDAISGAFVISSSALGVDTSNRFVISNAGNIGIGTVGHSTHRLDVNGSLNATSLFVGGTAFTGSQWTGTTNIYYTGNVGIGATTTSDVDDNTAFAIPTASLFVKGGASAGGTCDVVIRGGVAGQNNGKARLWLAADASHSSYIQSEHTGNGNTQLTFGTANGNVLPAERMIINSSGNIGIGITNPSYKMHLCNTAVVATGTTGTTCMPLRISAGAYSDTGNGTATLIGLATQETAGTVWTKCAIGHCRTTQWDIGSIVFLCNNSTTSSSVTMSDERMRITSTGNVGIGTNNPVNILQVGGGGRLRIANSTADYTIIGSSDVDAATNTKILIYGTTSSGASGFIQYFATSTGSHMFYTTDTQQERMRITSTGNVGIGTASPVYKLHIKCNYSDVAGSLHLDADDGSNNPNKYALTIYPYVIGGGEIGWRFRTQNLSGGTNTPLTLNNYGNVVVQNNLTAVSLTASGTIQASGAYYFPNNLWHKTNDGLDRFHFSASATTYIRGHGSTPIVFRNGGDTDIANISSAGELVVTGNKLAIKGGYPTIHLRHASNRTAFIHNNGDTFHILSGNAGASDTQDNWNVTANGRWPLTINLNNNNATFGGDVNAISLTSTNDITASGSIYLSGWLSKLGSSAAAWQYQGNIGTYWFIDLTSPLLYGGGNATLNIHNLVVWDSNTGSSFFAVLGFTGSYPQEALKLSQAAKNKGIQIDVGFSYNGSGNPLLYITGSSSGNQMYYRLT